MWGQRVLPTKTMTTKTATDATDAELRTDHLDTPSAENKRIVRALSNLWLVEERDEPGGYRVHSESGSAYKVNIMDMTCPCGDDTFMCKHLFRVVAETGITPLNAGEQENSITFTDDEYAEVVGATKVLNDGETIRETFGATDGEHDGTLTTVQCANVIDAVNQRLRMSGKFGADNPDAARSAITVLRESQTD